jgi:homoserine kinase type II
MTEEELQTVKADVAELLLNYDLGIFNNLARTEGGFTNENYIVNTTAGNFFLKKYLRVNDEKILREHRILEYLKQQSFCVPKLILNKNCQTLTEYKGEFYAFFELVAGSSVVATNQVSDRQMKNIAEILARYHHLAAYLPTADEPLSPIADKNYLEELYHQVANLLQNKKEPDDYDKMIDSVLDLKIKEFANAPKIDYDRLPSLLVHGDFHADNILFDQNGEIVAVVDWELVKHQPRIWEVLCAAFFCAKLDWTWNFHTPVDFHRAQNFLAAYHAINPFTTEEIAQLPAILKSASADLSWPLKVHYMHKNFAADRFLPKKTENWFFWNDKNIARLTEIFQEISSGQKMF